EQRLVRVDVADARELALVQQPVADGDARAARERVQPLGGQLIRERLDAEALLPLLPLSRGNQLEAPEATDVVVEDGVAVVEDEPRGDVAQLAGARRAAEDESARHPEVHEQDA